MYFTINRFYYSYAAKPNGITPTPSSFNKHVFLVMINGYKCGNERLICMYIVLLIKCIKLCLYLPQLPGIGYLKEMVKAKGFEPRNFHL
jgi:hypothetical protein